MSANQILGWIVVVLLVLFVVSNLQPASVSLFSIRIEMPMALVVISSAVLGASATGLLSKLRKSGK